MIIFALHMYYTSLRLGHQYDKEFQSTVTSMRYLLWEEEINVSTQHDYNSIVAIVFFYHDGSMAFF
jgi:hypothetical protein